MQLKNLKSPYVAEQASKALFRHAKKQFEGRPSVTDYLTSFNLSYVVPESFQSLVGWRDEWAAHILYPTTECVDSINRAAVNAWKAETAIVDIADNIDVE
jgi:hypothetical protein